MAPSTPFVIVMPVYHGVNILDVAGPREMFGWWDDGQPERNLKIRIAAERAGPIPTYSPTSNPGLSIVADTSFQDVNGADLLWVPGGGVDALEREMKNAAYMNFLKRIAQDATYVTSVCEGAMLLAHAGLLDGFQATTHWAFVKCLAKYPKVRVIPDPTSGGSPVFPRYVVDDHGGTLKKGIRVTGGGISSGLDESLKLISLIAGTEIAESVQLSTQYFPEPPVHSPKPQFADCPMSSLNSQETGR